MARQVLHADLRLLADLDAHVAEAEERIAALIPATRYGVLWQRDAAARAYAARLQQRGKHNGIITALAPEGEQDRLRHGPRPDPLRPRLLATDQVGHWVGLG